jgi:hypothetical protein
LGFFGLGCGELDGVVRVGLGHLCVAFGFLRVEVRADALDVLIPITPDVVPVALGLVGDLSRFGTQLGLARVGILPSSSGTVPLHQMAERDRSRTGTEFG